MRKRALPFTVDKTENFFDRLGDYVGDVFYDILPEQGYELRDEQIYMAFQLEQAFKHKKTIFAEAGVGTGKTLVYLLYAICYARYQRKPAIISCADESLIEQLVKKGGDIEKLEQALGLDIDIRLAKAREQYVCMKKLDPLAASTTDESILRVHDAIPDFVFDSGGSLQRFERYGDRKEYPWVSNEAWEQIAWDPLQQCATCEWRHRSGQTLNREYYRHAEDLIICSHDFYMEHIWTKESRKREGQLPLLPEASCVIFDEGHLLEFAAQKGLTYRIDRDTLTNVMTGYMGQDVREETLVVMEQILDMQESWFRALQQHAKTIAGSNRLEIQPNPALFDAARQMGKLVEQLLEQLVFDAELFTMESYHLKIIEEYLEFFSYALSILTRDDEAIIWLEENKDDVSLVIMPRLVEDVLKKEVFSQKQPFVFSSATLSQAGDFTHIAASLGLENYEAMTVASPFDYDAQMKIAIHVQEKETDKWEAIGEQLADTGGGTLLLFTSEQEMNRFRVWALDKKWDFPMRFEGDQEISVLVKDFQENLTTVLCSYHLWEGLDVPGEALSQVIIGSLPYPPKDPVFEAKRKHAVDPIKAVELPYMLLRLQQGIGRLIRTNTDHGNIHIWMRPSGMDIRSSIAQVLPVAASWPAK